MTPSPELRATLDVVRYYHDATKHHFQHFARSLGYLDWETQPDPFRTYDGAEVLALDRAPAPPQASFAGVLAGTVEPRPLDHAALSTFFRYSMAVSAWKEHLGARWALRVNPSSGNLHPTEAYAVLALPGETAAAVCHYVASRHVLERRRRLDPDLWRALAGGLPAGGFFAGLTSIHWREAWKYGERAFRYCQHDTGHALAALRIAAALLGWELRLLPGWGSDAIARLLGLAAQDAETPPTAGAAQEAGPEPEEPELLCFVRPNGSRGEPPPAPPLALLESLDPATFEGVANRLSPERVDWPIIDEVARATRRPSFGRIAPLSAAAPPLPAPAVAGDGGRIILQRRSAVSMAPGPPLARDAFFRMLASTLPGARVPFDAVPWAAEVHLLLFVHRVEGLEPGLYFLPRAPGALEQLRETSRPDHLFQPDPPVPHAPPGVPLHLMKAGDCRRLAALLSCDQEIAADGFFSLGMIARFDEPLARHGSWFYRNLFWETGVIGQILYLMAEAEGLRATGIGCFYDDPVHDVLGLAGAGDHAFQSLYHFTVGIPVDDPRISTLPAYAGTPPLPGEAAADRQT